MSLSFSNFLVKNKINIPEKSASAVLELSAEGGTVPFIARYRKEKTGNLDEVQIRDVIDSFEKYNEVLKRKEFLLKEIESQGNLTELVKESINKSYDLGELDEIYRPFKRKKKTKATVAREAGLEPLADWIWQLGHDKDFLLSQKGITLEVKAKEFINAAKKIITYEVALKGAQDITIEKIANDPGLREMIRQNFFESGKVVCKETKKFKENSKFEMYKDYEEAVSSIQSHKSSHRYLAIRRGWQDSELTVAIKGDDDLNIKKYMDFSCEKECFGIDKQVNPAAEFLQNCGKLALTTHVTPSISNEVHRFLKEKADKDGISVFAENVRKVLLASPFGAKCVLGIDPGLRTGCKVALIDPNGMFVSSTVMHILGDNAEKSAEKLFSEVLKQIKIEAVAIGNGTAGRETEAFVRKVLKKLSVEGKDDPGKIPVIMVNESGASIYSASEIAREEFPDLDLTVRGAISIARRLQDPLSELVKTDPKSIGVGQYQHDVSQTLLKKGLHDVVEDCVNQIGVDLNTASPSLISYVSGVGPTLSKNIIEYRKKNGAFKDRTELQNVSYFSSKVFEQAAGFLRIPDGDILLDSTGIHPERYAVLKDMAAELKVPVSKLLGEGAKSLIPLKEKWVALVGEYTFDDIIKELEKPGRDPRDPYKVFSFREDIHEVKDLKEDMLCPGIVTNVTNFGAFVDVGVHQDGLVHISELANQFVDDPRKIVNPGDIVKVKVKSVDVEKNQISFSMKLTENKKSPVKAKISGNKNANNKSVNSKGGERKTFNKKNSGKKFDKKSSGGKNRSNQPPRKPRQTFNNPFAGLSGLADLKDQLKK